MNAAAKTIIGSALFSLVLALTGGGCASQPQTTATAAAPTTKPTSIAVSPADVAEVQHSVFYLASDKLEGRGVGTPGLDMAADYITDRFHTLGLRPLPGLDGYFQPFPYVRGATVSPQTVLAIDGNAKKLTKEFTPLATSGTGGFDGQLVFVGYGVVSPENKYDDYAGIDVRGKVVLAMRYEPHDAQGHSLFTHKAWSKAAGFAVKAQAAFDRGAKALIIVNPPLHHAGGDSLIPFAFFNNIGTEPGQIPVIQIRRELTEQLLSEAGAPPLKDLQQQIDSTGAPASRSLGIINVVGNVQFDRNEVQAKNVVAMLPGEGPHANEYVIVGAHYDHLGHGGFGSLAPWSHAIHHGADDNASGTSAVLELADHLVRHGRLDRSIIFCCFSAEEEGLIGSAYFANHPPVPLSKVVAMLNMDMVGRVRKEVIMVGGDGTAANFGQLMQQADANSPLVLKDMGKGGFGPSDHMSFALKKVPVIFLFSGLHEDYHRPTDTAEKINYTGMVETVLLSENIVDQMAVMPAQAYVATFDNEELNLGDASTIASGPRTSLGVVPDYGAMDSNNGVKISGARAGTPADAAGLKEGDVIVEIGGTKIGNLMDLTTFLTDAKPGDKVTIVVERNNQRVDLHTTLAERRS